MRKAIVVETGISWLAGWLGEGRRWVFAQAASPASGRPRIIIHDHLNG